MLRECGAIARTNDNRPCRQYALPNGRCRFHGGKSTGAKTEEGRRKIKKANLKHGLYSAEAQNELRRHRALIKSLKSNL